MAKLLKKRGQTCLDLAGALDLRPAEALSHLEHLRRTYKKQFKITPAKCRDCSFLFKGRSRLNTPGRCPQCRSQRVDGPWFAIQILTAKDS